MINACKDELNRNGIYLLNPKGNSMRPFIKHRCKVIVVPKTERLKLYDVALYEREDKTLVLHRVIEVLDDGYVFVGDSTIDTEIVSEEAVFAVMIAFTKGKTTVDVNSKRYLTKVKKYYSNLKKREKIIKRITRRANCCVKLKRLFSKKKGK